MYSFSWSACPASERSTARRRNRTMRPEREKSWCARIFSNCCRTATWESAGELDGCTCIKYYRQFVVGGAIRFLPSLLHEESIHIHEIACGPAAALTSGANHQEVPAFSQARKPAGTLPLGLGGALVEQLARWRGTRVMGGSGLARE